MLSRATPTMFRKVQRMAPNFGGRVQFVALRHFFNGRKFSTQTLNAPPKSWSENHRLNLAIVSSGLGSIAAGSYLAHNEVEEDVKISNWSGTHEVSTKRYYQPESLKELEAIVAEAHKEGRQLRPVGNALSPNGIGLAEGGMLSMGLMDNILSVDKETGLVRVQAGARVAQVVEALRPHGLTLQNYASIAEQQIGGFVQVGAHGTGAMVPPVDEQVVALKLVTPGQGTLELSAQDADPSAFYLARVGLGGLGVVAEVVLRAVPAHRLTEHCFVATRAFVRENHKQLLQENRHIRYMWIPHTDKVVVVACNPEGRGLPAGPPSLELHQPWALDERTEAMRQLLAELRPGTDAEALRGKAFSELRDLLLAVAPLDTPTVVRVNEAEAEFWERNQGYRTDWSDKILGFDCGGQQWVSEVAFPSGSLDNPQHDLDYMTELLAAIEERGLPAPAPIEQRWTAPSASPMSPASAARGALHSWVGVIMYLPTDDPSERKAITSSFFEYVKVCEQLLWDRYNAVLHWAKIENPTSEQGRQIVQERLRKQFPTAAYAALRREYDPKGILENDLLRNILAEEGRPLAELRRKMTASLSQRFGGW